MKPRGQWWKSWNDGLHALGELSVPRSINPWSGKDVNRQLHIFCDASEDAFAAVVYLRSENSVGNVEVRLICSKTRVSPKRPLTIPKLELQAAVLGSRLANHLKTALRLELSSRTFWTDSMVVKAWTTSLAQKYKPFVSHRIGEIQSLTDAVEWRHLPGKKNPADLATRVMLGPEMGPLWTSGPEFLWHGEDAWPPGCKPGSAEEVLRTKYSQSRVHLVLAGEKAESLNAVLSDLKPVDEPDEDSSMTRLLNIVQAQPFPEEIRCLTSATSSFLKNSRVKDLSPFLDESGILRARGRLSRAQIGYDQKFPIILCPKHPTTQLILDEHEKMHHPGVNHGLALLRQRFWVLKGREAVRKIRWSCRTCSKMTARPVCQEMSDLPEERLAIGRPPFFHTSMDLFGPMEILVLRNKIEKRRRSVFACMTTRAVHIELASSLSTQDFLNCFRNFVNLRGQPSSVYCDNGTNFVGAKHLLASLCASKGGDKHTEEIQWKFQPPGATH